MHILLLTIAAVLAGAAVPFQGAANAGLGRALGHPLWATLTSLAVSVACIVPVMIVMRVPPPTLGTLLAQPKWVWIGGVAGVAYITAAILLMPKLGAAGFMTAVIAGQTAAALAIDYFGVLGMAARPVDATRVIGVAMVILGGIISQWATLFKA